MARFRHLPTPGARARAPYHPLARRVEVFSPHPTRAPAKLRAVAREPGANEAMQRAVPCRHIARSETRIAAAEETFAHIKSECTKVEKDHTARPQSSKIKTPVGNLRDFIYAPWA